MNTGHDGSMGTLHANNPREALSRCESMITMGGFSLPSRTIREMICASIDVIIQAARLRDGSRRITHITEVMGMEGDTIITQDVFLYDMVGEDANGKIIGRHRSTGIGRPRFWERARYYGEEKRLAAALDAAEVASTELTGDGHEDAGSRAGLSCSHRNRRRLLGFPLSAAVRRAQGRATPQFGRQAGTRGAAGREDPALAPRAGGILAEGLEARAQKQSKVALSARITQAGLDWTAQKFWTISAVFGAAVLVVAFLAGGGPLGSLGLGFAQGSACRAGCSAS